jgi:hypothetical protein
MGAATEAEVAPDVRLTKAVADELEGMPKAQADAVRVVLDRVGRVEGEPVDLPGAAPGTQYLALTPPGRKAPAVIYRPMLPEEDGDWLVTSLIPREQWNAWSAILQTALSNPAVTAAVAGAATAFIRAMVQGAKG